MTSTMSAFAPAGVLGSGRLVTRPYACADVRPALLAAVAGVQGSGLPSVWMTGAGALVTPPIDPQFEQTTQNDGTTLGIHPRGRSTS
jgi:hypothetical protein